MAETADVVVVGGGVIGTSAEYFTARNQEIQLGRLFSDDEYDSKDRVVVIGSGVAEELFPDVARAIGAQAEDTDRAGDVLGTNFNSSEKKHKHGAKKPVLSVSDWLGIDAGLREILEAQCGRFGYDLPWMPAAPADPKR